MCKKTRTLEEVGLSLHRDQLHPIERVLRVVKLVVPERDEQPVRHKLDILAHQGRVHTDQGDRQRVGQELLFDLDGFGDDAGDAMRSGTALEVRKEEAGKIGVETFVTRDELVLRSNTSGWRAQYIRR